MRHRAFRGIPFIAALALSSCATPGNFTTYRVSCQTGDKAVRGVVTTVANNVAGALHKSVRVVQDQPAQLMLAIDLSSDFWSGSTVIGFRWVNEGNVAYEISIDQRETRRETEQVGLVRETIEKAVSQSTCPTFHREISNSQELKYS